MKTSPARILAMILVCAYIVLCVLVLAARWLATNKIDSVREDLVRAVSEASGVEVNSAKFEISFHYIWPVVHLSDVTLARRDGPVSLKLPRVDAELSWSSIMHLEPRFRVLQITNPEFTIRRLSDSVFDIGGFVVDVNSASRISNESENDQPSESRGTGKALSWLFSQGELSLNSGRFTYVDERRGRRTASIEKASAVFQQDFLGWRAAAEGSVIENGVERGFVVRSRIDKSLFSNPSDPLTWSGKIYARFDRIDFGYLMRRFGYGQLVKSGKGAVRLWTSFNDGRITEFVADLGLNVVKARLDSELDMLNLPLMTGRVRYIEDKAGAMSFSAENIQFQVSGRQFGPADIEASCGELLADGNPQKCRFHASKIDIGTLNELSRSLPLPAAATSFLKEHPFSGSLTNIDAEFTGDYKTPGNWRFSTYFYGLSMGDADDRVPTFRNLAGFVSSPSPGRFNLHLDSPISTLRFPGVFRNPAINLDSLKADAVISLEDAPSISVTSFSASNSDASVAGSGSWKMDDELGYINLHGSISRAKGESVPKYLPRVIGEKTLDYLESSILSGKASNGTWEVRGRLVDFPWHNFNPSEGRFRIEADVVDGKFDFLPSLSDSSAPAGDSWPVLEKISAHLLFEGNRMLITGKSLASRSLSGSGITVEIPDYTSSPARLLIQGDIHGKGEAAVDYLKNSRQLNEILEGVFGPLSAKGSTETKLSLDIPLSHPEKLKYSVSTTLNDVDVTWGDSLPTSESTNGVLIVENGLVYTPMPLSGILSGKPLQTLIRTTDDAAVLEFEGRAALDDVDQIFGIEEASLAGMVSGSAPVHVEAKIPFSSKGFSISGKTSLEGLSSSLPEPLKKAAEEKWNSSFEYSQTPLRADLKVVSSGFGSIAAEFAREESGLRLESGTFCLGKAACTPVKKGGISAFIDIDELNLDEWAAAFEKQPQAAPIDPVAEILKDNSLAVSKPAAALNSVNLRNISNSEVKIKRLEWKNALIEDLRLSAFSNDLGWRAEISSSAITGSVSQIYGGSGLLKADFSKLYLPDLFSGIGSSSNIDNPTSSIPLHVPDLDIVLDNFKIGERDFGKFELKAENEEERLSINKVSLTNIGARAEGSGSWTYPTISEPSGTSSLRFNIDVQDAGVVLHSLGVNDVVHRAPGSTLGFLSWKGQPHQFNLKSLSGSFQTQSGAGRILQVEPGAGRLLSLFSMQHVLRRLTLDFSDVVSKGFSFDSFSSDVQIQNGLMKLKKASLYGSAAAIGIEGDIDLVNEVLDLDVVVVPSLNTEGASIALAIANPAVGIGTLVAQLAFKDKISQLFSMEYQVRGGFDSPEVIKRSKERVQETETLP